MSDVSRDLATLAASIRRLEDEIASLRRRLKAVRDCQNARCHLCINCLNSVHEDD